MGTWVNETELKDYSDSEILYMLRDLPDACCIFKVITDPFGTVRDLQFLFANEKYASLLGIPVAELIGSNYYDLNSNRDEDWIKLSYQAAILRQSSINRTFNTRYKKWFEFWVVPVYKKGYCAYIIHDVTAEQQKEEKRALTRKTNNIIIECAKLMSTHEFKKGLKAVLKNLGIAIAADRVYVVENKSGEPGKFFEWFNRDTGIGLPAEEAFKKFDFFTMWEKQLNGDDIIVVDDTKPISDKNQEVYDSVLEGTIARYIIAPLINKSENIGYLVADNYSTELDIDLREVFVSVAIFVSAEMNNYILTQELTYLTNHDTLTGMGNRLSLQSTQNMLKSMNVPVGICYSDINGLKEINDSQGHEAGDILIQNAAMLISSVYKTKYCYRVGGDEFIAVIPSISRDKFDELNGKLNDKITKKQKELSLAKGVVWIENSKDIEEAIREADIEMYKDKAQYYTKRDRRKK